TVIEANGKFYVYATGNGLPAFASDDGWTTLTHPSSAAKPPDGAGFLQRWLVLEPIKVPGQLTESAVRAAIGKEYFPNQPSIVPRDGDTVTAGDERVIWHAVDTTNYNVNLYHF